MFIGKSNLRIVKLNSITERKNMIMLFKKKQSKEQKQQESVQNLIPLKAIDSGLLLTPDNRLIQILKVSAINLELMSYSEQMEVFEEHEAFLKSITFDHQVEVISEPVDLKAYIKDQEAKLDQAESPIIKKLLSGYVDYAKAQETSRNVMQRQRYFIFDEKIKGSTKKAYEEALYDLLEKKEHVISGLSELDLMTEDLLNEEILKILQIFFNYEGALYQPILSDIVPEIVTGGNKK